MSLNHVRQIVIVGGGTAGWMSAAALSKLLPSDCRIHLVESDEIGSIGVGEATIPNIKNFNAALEIDEDEFVRATQGTFKLGIEFVNWGALGDRYIHGFGKVGQELDAVAFHHYWLRLQREGLASDLGDYSINTVAPQHAKFMRARPDMAGSPLADIASAFQFDASLYARFLRGYAEKRGVLRSQGKVVEVLQREPDGHITAVRLDSGELIEGDFFVDCSGMHALLIAKTLQVGFEDWSHWLPCDRAIAVPCESAGPLLPLTRATAHGAGWQWRIPLQHRTGNGHVYASRFMGDAEASDILMRNLDGKPLAEPRLIKFQPGRRERSWERNCVAVGLSSGFLEPLESTSIHLIQTALARLVSLFPHRGFDAADIDEYNRQTQFEYERIRDFIILHYKATERDDSAFWNHCRLMDVPATLQRKIDLYRSNARIYREGGELFAELSWLQVMNGQGIRPSGYHPFADQLPKEEAVAFMANVKEVIARCVKVMPTQADFIAQHCAAIKV
ncbi:tryptophan 7-halogenase [Paucibacter sp. B2R-40]|uniref:tryptophan halogenase family protein n=1 Tax=Paucibacter sp. B2R-40 TaxID=2893554 RepID=UPI0021E4F13E|nr:tryptophan halogenase family protein [Paucibacter sp. B2R-40]MCV2356024.1 tryptophan 7-halogenase [Paucibacter sp. B2R-40]